jgi:demethylmenaquinone methyltransferase/2-methoxy-6-polyprenyl-1,4-benzoquinol methylase
MRLLESAPSRYDRGMRWLTLGRVDEMRDVLVAAVESLAADGGAEVLEIGCGTGALTAALLAGGARVTALDQSPEMLELARARLADTDHPRCELLERTASEIDQLAMGSFDAVVAGFSFSEMSPSERAFVLARARERLRPGGLLAVADEVRPERALPRALFALLRAPQALISWIVVGSVSRPIQGLEGEIESAGFRLRAREDWLWGHLSVVIAESSRGRRPKGTP